MPIEPDEASLVVSSLDGWNESIDSTRQQRRLHGQCVCIVFYKQSMSL